MCIMTMLMEIVNLLGHTEKCSVDGPKFVNKFPVVSRKEKCGKNIFGRRILLMDWKMKDRLIFCFVDRFSLWKRMNFVESFYF